MSAEMASMTPRDRARLDVDLKEIEIVFAQGHTRMTLISYLTNMSIALSGAVIAGVAAIEAGGKWATLPLETWLVVPLPFFLLGFLVLREDILMAFHDRYFYELRRRLLDSLALSEADPALRFLPAIAAAKIGGRLFTLLSVLRYGPPFIVVPLSLACFVWNATWLLTIRGFIAAGLLVANLALVLLLLVGLKYLGRLHADNEALAPVVHVG